MADKTFNVEKAAVRAYVAYGDAVGGKNYQGLPMPTWDALPPSIQGAWRAATTSVELSVRRHLEAQRR